MKDYLNRLIQNSKGPLVVQVHIKGREDTREWQIIGVDEVGAVFNHGDQLCFFPWSNIDAIWTLKR